MPGEPTALPIPRSPEKQDGENPGPGPFRCVRGAATQSPGGRLAFLDAFVAPSLRSGPESEVLRARYCAAAVLLTAGVVIWSVATSLAHGNRTMVGVSLAVGGLALSVLGVLRWVGSVRLAGALLTGLVFAYTVGLAWASGGQALAGLYGSGLVVFLGVLFGGPRAGLAWAAVCVVALIGLEAAVRAGASFPLEFSAAHRESLHFRGPLVNVLVMLLASVAHDSLQRRFLRRVEEARGELAASERRYADLVRHAPLGIVACDPDGTVRLANPRLLRLLGSPAEDVAGTVNLFRHPGLQRAGVSVLFRRAMAEGRPFSEEVTYDSRWGVRVSARLHLAPIRDSDGRVSGAQALVEDISEERRLAAERKRVEARIQEAQRLESLGLLAAGVAHDFNNLLTPVLIHAGALRAELPADSPLAGPLEQIERAATRAGELTGQLLAYAGSRPVDPEAVDLSGLVQEMTDLLRAAVPPRVELRTSLDPGLEPVRGQPTALRQVVLNLVTNACDAVGEGRHGRVEVRVRRVDLERPPPGVVGGQGFAPGGWVAVEVEDDGCGMDPATRARIFDPFFTTRARGRGLGLAAVLGIVRSHGGFLAIESEPGRGSVFRVFLPAGGFGDPSLRARERPGPARAPAGAAVLVVDDDPAILDAAARALRSAGYAVWTAPDGPTALELFLEQAGRFDGVVLDLTMPGMDGGEVLAALRRWRPGVPVLLSSGYAAPERVRAALDLGAGGFLPKPYSAADLVRSVGTLISGEGRA